MGDSPAADWRWWRERRPTAEVLHLDTAAAGRSSLATAAVALCRAAGVPLWVDAAQALGHVDTACGADAIYATSRKWLTGPRGVGVVGITEPWWDDLRVTASQLERSARPADSSPLWLLSATEANVAAWVGLCVAVAEHLAADPARIWARQRLPRPPRHDRTPAAHQPHVDCTPDDLARLRQALLALS